MHNTRFYSCVLCKGLGYQYRTLTEFDPLNARVDLDIDFSFGRWLKSHFPVTGTFYIHVLVSAYRDDPKLCSLCGGMKKLHIAGVSVVRDIAGTKVYYPFKEDVRCFYCKGSGDSNLALMTYFENAN